MTKLAASIVLTVLVTGIGVYLFVGGQSIKQHTLAGNEKWKATVRAWDYESN